MPRLSGEHVQIGGAIELQGAADRLAELEETLERIYNEKVLQAESDARKILQKARMEAEEIARNIIQAAEIAAENHARAIVQEAENHRDTTLQQAYEEGEGRGFQKGYEDGFNQSESDALQMLNTAKTVLEGAYLAQTQVLQGFRKQSAALIAHIAKKVIRQELEVRPELLLNLIDGAIQTLHLSGKIKVVIGAEGLQQLKACSETLADQFQSLSRLNWVVDPHLEQFEIYIIGEEGGFLLNPDVQAEKLSAVLTDKLPLAEKPEI